MTDKNYDSSDEKDVAKAKRREHNETQAEINDLCAIMATKPGRRFIWRQLSKCGVYRASFSLEPLLMAHKEGARNLGLELLAMLVEHCLSEYQLMEKEQRRQAAMRAKSNTDNQTEGDDDV